VSFLFIWTNIPAKPPRGAYISQLILYSRACDSYYDFLEIWLLLIRKLLIQWFLVIKLKSSLWLFYVCNHDLVNGYGIAVSHMATEYLCHTWPRNICVTHGHGISVSHMATEYMCHTWPRNICNHNIDISSFMNYHRICIRSNIMDATAVAEIANPSGATKFTVGFFVFCRY
jgi:hypothetical protein